MTNPTPQKKVNELIDSINEMIKSGQNKDRIEEIEYEANKLKGYGQFTDAYNVLGMTAALKGQSSETDRIFSAAINHEGSRTPNTLINYATALNNLGRLCKAVVIIDEVVSMAPENLFYITEAIRHHHDACDFTGVIELTNRAETLGTNINLFKEDVNNFFVADLLTEHNVSWQELSTRIEIASNTLHNIGLVPRFNRLKDIEGVLYYEFNIDADSDLVSKGENAIIDAIAQEPYSPVDDLLYITCSTL
ncbi:MAG: hypothetical protein ABIR84_12415 [Candidatus Nitrotoga sp.]